MQEDLYANLRYSVRAKLDVSIAEYFYLDMVHQLSHSRWCTKANDAIAKDMGITERGVRKMRDRLIVLGWIEKNAHGAVKTTNAYFDLAVIHTRNKVPAGRNKVPLKAEQSSYKINKKNKDISGLSAEDEIARRYSSRATKIPANARDPERASKGRG